MRFRIFDCAKDAEAAVPILSAASRELADLTARSVSSDRKTCLVVVDYTDHADPAIVGIYQYGRLIKNGNGNGAHK